MTDSSSLSPTAPVAAAPVLAIEDLCVSFRGRSGVHQAMNGISFEIHPGEIVAVVGESGSGKSVTSLAIMGPLGASARTERGSILFRDRRGKQHDLSTLNEEQRRNGDDFSGTDDLAESGVAGGRSADRSAAWPSAM